MDSIGPVRSVGLVVALHKEGVTEIARALTAALRARGAKVFASEEVAEAIGGSLEVAPEAELVRQDLAVVLGGDGTFLRTAVQAAPIGTPLLGVYVGGFGFLTETNAELFEAQADRVIRGEYYVDERMMLSACAECGGERHECIALNDIAIHRGQAAGLLACDVTVDGLEVGGYSGDGVIVATPTGSTAYSLAAGGPVVHPRVECLIITPMLLHSLNIRPLVVGGESEICIRLVGRHQVAELGAVVSADGENILRLHEGDTLTIRRSSHRARLARLARGTFIDRLRQKLRWGAEI